MAMTEEEIVNYNEQVKLWLEKGNKITQCPAGERTEDITKINRWKGRPKKKVDKSA